MKISPAMQHPQNADSFALGIEDQIVSETADAPRPKAGVSEFWSTTSRTWVLSKEFESVVGVFQKPTRRDFIGCAQVTEGRLQIAEYEFAFLVGGRHHASATIRSIEDRSPGRNRPFAASSSRAAMCGGVSDSSVIQRSRACRATSSGLRYPSAICRSMNSLMGSVSETSMPK